MVFIQSGLFNHRLGDVVWWAARRPDELCAIASMRRGCAPCLFSGARLFLWAAIGPGLDFTGWILFWTAHTHMLLKSPPWAVSLDQRANFSFDFWGVHHVYTRTRYLFFIKFLSYPWVKPEYQFEIWLIGDVLIWVFHLEIDKLLTMNIWIQYLLKGWVG
jgi:hypothetical protein